ncbi:MAG: FKBP-type peptidyl-prolyl cis-trans isomerase [Bacteroidota bacterium]|nr:FKBP-type peptidyl-prolyl cis-trans isomerase [Bacteroidota bacterium]
MNVLFCMQMKKLIIILFFIIPAALFSFHKKGWKHTASGIYYKIYTCDTSKEKPVYGDHIWMHLQKFGLNNKEIFNTKIFDAKIGVEMDFKKPEKKADVTEIFAFMGKGDSAMVVIPSDLADSNGSKKKYYTFNLYLIDFKRKDVYLFDKNEQYKQQMVLDSLAILDYITNNDLHDCVRDEYGNWFVRKQQGTGKPVKENDTIKIHYTGKLTSGKVFDNSYERKEPLSFIVGKKQVIDGLDKGIRDFFYGDAGTLIIPSRLSYGDREVGKIPANSVLIFEIEILP